MMFVALALATLAADVPHPTPARIVLQSTVTVRIVGGERVSPTKTPETALVRTIVVKNPAGLQEQRRLVEFP